ncbi:NUDIX hydrolase [Roseitalea porphyridii]|uniref:Uncharacterized protein n=1 Tax=Roseitalea porphyridii TaxID=1852022 RepID=A0A4P6V3U6_9HYPH|nr:NUDIX domain-containing protein [Roseitalea porphyridii]QBK31419.1 hypothetical protein E0E05_12890 [Roseitalea porphyridii]
MIAAIDSTDLHLTDAPLDFAMRHREAIAAHWRRATAANPRLWNGPQFLFTEVSVEGGVLTGRAHRTDFATFLYWRDHGRDPSATHITGTSLPVTADGALLAIRMAGHTANAGQLYFPAGSLDPADATGGAIDIDTNIRRELAEETGLEPAPETFDAMMIGSRADNAWHVARRCRLALSFEACAERVRAHQARTGDDEVDAVLAIRSAAEAAPLRDYARALALWHFDDQEKGERR